MSEGLNGKKIIWNGDSICAGSQICGNWATRICEKNNMPYKNYAVGGGTICAGFAPGSDGTPRHSVYLTLDTMYEEHPDADYIVFEGGCNDVDRIEILGETNITDGIVDPDDFSGNYDLNTFSGYLETIFYRALKYWQGKKICYIVAHKMWDDLATKERRRRYYDKAVEVCKKWGIPYLDLWNDCYLNPELQWMYNPYKSPDENCIENTGFYIDAQHLTAKGYDFTADIIERWLERF